jgi:hypothetical protein
MMKMVTRFLKRRHYLLLLLSVFVTVSANASTCSYCYKEIADKWIKVDGKTFHVEHFICSNCLKPIGTGEFYKHDGNYYDRVCYENFITDKCYYCARPILNEFITYESNIYHATCFNDHVGERCIICNEVAVGGGFIDIRGNAVCEKHRDDVLDCHSCFSFVPQDFSDGSSRYADGRIICKHCQQTAVVDEDEASAVMEEVKAKLAGAGLIIKQEFKLEFVSLQRLSKQSSNYQADQLGVTKYKKTGILAGLISFQDFEIYILSGLPRAQLRAVLAHELMHVWQFKNAPYPQDLQLCEGSCQFAAYLALRDDESAEGRFFLNYIEQHKDSIYGDGFRNVLKEVDRRGFESWLEFLKEQQEPPW